MMNKFSVLFSVSILSLLLTSCTSVLVVGRDEIPTRKVDGKEIFDLPERCKAIEYNGFGFDWNVADGFGIIPVENTPDNLLWLSDASRRKDQHAIFFRVEKLTHYQRKSDLKHIRKYLERLYAVAPGSKVELKALELTECKFKGVDAIFVYMESYDAGRKLHQRECSYFFSDPMHRESKIYSVSWSERGRTNSWRSKDAERLGKLFFTRFRLLSYGF